MKSYIWLIGYGSQTVSEYVAESFTVVLAVDSNDSIMVSVDDMKNNRKVDGWIGLLSQGSLI